MSIVCQHSEICAACPWMPVSYAEQSQRKTQLLSDRLQPLFLKPLPVIQFISVGDSSQRDRADFVAFEGGYGLYTQDKKLFSVKECPQLSPKLLAFYQDLKIENIKLKNSSHSKGSLRLRISPSGERGLWLDFSHVDVQHLFEEKHSLHRLLGMAYVEIGQRHKKLVWDLDENRFRLRDPEFHTWTRTWIDQQEIPLFSVVGGFSQSSDHANRIIVQKISEMLSQSGKGNWIEFGCGNGNLTFPLAMSADQVLALEYEGLAVDGLQKTFHGLKESLKNLAAKIEVRTGNFQKSLPQIFSEKSVQGLLVNPPRSGLKDFLKPLADLEMQSRPQDFIYMSCYLESFLIDAEEMISLGYEPKELCIIDQFPQSPHFEILSRWSL